MTNKDEPEILLTDASFIPLCLFGCFIEFVSIFLNFTVLCTFTKISTIHQNMRLACCNLWMCNLLRSFFRIIILFHFIVGSNIIIQSNYGFWINFIHGMCNCCTYFLEIAIFGERIASALWTRTYEKFSSRLFTTILLLTPVILAQTQIVYFYDVFFQWFLALLVSYMVLVLAIIEVMTCNYTLIVLLIITWLVSCNIARLREMERDRCFT